MSASAGVSAGCHERMRHLSRVNVRGYHADIDLTRIASCMHFVVEIKIPSTHSKRFERGPCSRARDRFRANPSRYN